MMLFLILVGLGSTFGASLNAMASGTNGSDNDKVECLVGTKYFGAGSNEDNRTSVICDAGLICSKISTDLYVTVEGIPVTVSLSVGQCMTSMDCEEQKYEDLRSYLPSYLLSDLTGCSIMCCEADGVCNGKGSLGPPVGGYPDSSHYVITSDDDLSCYVGTQEIAGGITTNSQTTQPCGDSESCLTMTTDVYDRATGVTSHVTIGRCMPTATCNQYNCTQVLADHPLASSLTFINCTANCCQKNLCNFPETTTPTTTETPVSESNYFLDSGEPECLVGVKYSGVMDEDFRNLVKCDAGSYCSKLSIYIPITDSSNYSYVEIFLEQCKSASSCWNQNCEDLRQHIPSDYLHQFDGCGVECCGASGMCLASSLIVSPAKEFIISQIDMRSSYSDYSSSQDTETLEDGLECYEGYFIKAGNRTTRNSQTVKTCNPGSSCSYLRIFSFTNYTRTTNQMSMSKCVPTHACNRYTCAQVLAENSLPPTDTLVSCTDDCCQEDRCNPLTTSQSSGISN